jgi:streptomycin 6-kinase
MDSGPSTDVWNRFDDRVRAWQVVIEHVIETDGSVVGLGRRGRQPVVLKVIKSRGEEWRSGEILGAFEGRGAVRVYDRVDGAMLLERLLPGVSLVGMSLGGADDDATLILAQTIAAMSPRRPAGTVSTVQDWARAFDRCRASGDPQVPGHLLSRARRMYSHLCDTQAGVRLLHGDLHHDNVLFDETRGWLAVDPKGVVGELAYEVGAALRNPAERPQLYAEPEIIRRRVERFSRELQLDPGRVLSWAFAQAVLAAVWAVEDGLAIEPGNGWVALADVILPMLDERFDA